MYNWQPPKSKVAGPIVGAVIAAAAAGCAMFVWALFAVAVVVAVF